MGNKNRTVKNVLWNTIGSIYYSFCQWLITVVVVHIATFSDAGFLSIAMTTSSSFSAISLFSMRNYQVSDINGDYSVHEYFGSRILTSIVALVTCICVSAFGNTTYMLICISSFMLIRVAEAIADVLHGQDQKYNRYDYIGISYILRGTATVISFVIALKITGDMMITLIITAVINLVIAFLWDYLKTNRIENIRPVIYSNRVRQLLKSCAPLVVFSFLLSLENLVSKVALEKILGTEKLGIYSTIATPTLVVQVFAMVAFNPFLPAFSYNYMSGNIDRFKKDIYKLIGAFVGMYVAVLIGATLLGKPVLSLIFGKGILENYDLFIPIIWVTLLTGTIWVLSAVLIGMREIFFLLIAISISFTLCLIIVMACINKYGMNGASVAQIIPMVILCLAIVVKIIMAIIKKEKEIAR